MAVFVSGSDESAGNNQRDPFIFAGWVASEHDWSNQFIPAWQQRVLGGSPTIPYLHMTEMRSRQWRDEHNLSENEADRRIDEAFALIAKSPTLFPIGISVSGAAIYENFATIKVVAETGGSRKFDPDYLCFLAYAWMALNHVYLNHPECEKLDFIVERKTGVTKYIQEFHSRLDGALAALGHRHLSMLVGDFIPAGKESVQLQAADLLCWHTARWNQPQSMSSEDMRRYEMIAHRSGHKASLDRETISQLASALLPTDPSI
jgi:hypothetical protein